MSFWNTFVGELIHTVSFGLIGPDGGPSAPVNQPSNNGGTMSETELKCIGDFDFYMNNTQLCMQSTNHAPGITPTPPLPGTGTSGGGTVVINPPVSAVPEPSAIVLVACALIVLALRARFKRRDS